MSASTGSFRRRLDAIERKAGIGPASLGRTPAVWITTTGNEDRDRQLAELTAAGTYAPDRLLIEWRIVRPADYPRGPMQ